VKYTAAMTLAMMACGTVQAGMRNPVDVTTHVEIWYQFEALETPDVPWFQAQARATALLAEAGIILEWHHGRPEQTATGTHVIGIKFVGKAPEHFNTGTLANALAAARPYGSGTTITVFEDRVTRYMAPVWKADRYKVLGHVLAHEIVHVLEGVARHSDTGLMKGNWTSRDLREITRTGLPMSEEDRRLIAMRLERDAAGVAPVAVENATR
jgi:hypothetical protein